VIKRRIMSDIYEDEEVQDDGRPVDPDVVDVDPDDPEDDPDAAEDAPDPEKAEG